VNEEIAPEAQQDRTTTGTPFAWLSVEIALWVLLFAVALALRLVRLDAVPLSSSEAQDALAAWRFAQGRGAPASTGYSPALFTGQWLSFVLATASDWTARLLPALAGTLLVATPALLRHQVGRSGALLTGVLLTLSPTALFMSRFASGDILVALGAMLCIGGTGRLLAHARNAQQDSARQLVQSMVIGASGLALMLSAGPLGYSATIAIALALGLLAVIDPIYRDQLSTSWARIRQTPNLAYYGLGSFAAAFFLLSTAFSWHYGGLAAAADLVSQWLTGFVRWPDSLGPGYPGALLITYEPLILVASLAGVVLAAKRRDPMPRFFALWSLLALVLSWLRPGRGPGDVLLVLIPLACLGGLALARLIDSTRQHGHWANEGLFLAVTLPLWAYLLINLANYTSQPGEYSQFSLLVINVSLPTFLSLAIVSGFMVLVIAAGIGFVYGPASAMRGLALSATVALFVYTVATSISLSQQRANDPRELLVRDPTASETRLMVETLAHVSNKRSGDDYAIDLTVLSDDPALSWLLRDFKQARLAEPSGTPSFASIVVAPQTLGTPALGGEYVGQSFPLRRRWGPESIGCQWNQVQLGAEQVTQLDCNALASWLIYRRSPDPPTEEKVVVWLRKDLVGR
jgi:predicted membrane-bound mannosyltransferase